MLSLGSPVVACLNEWLTLLKGRNDFICPRRHKRLNVYTCIGWHLQCQFGMLMLPILSRSKRQHFVPFGKASLFLSFHFRPFFSFPPFLTLLFVTLNWSIFADSFGEDRKKFCWWNDKNNSCYWQCLLYSSEKTDICNICSFLHTLNTSKQVPYVLGSILAFILSEVLMGKVIC